MSSGSSKFPKSLESKAGQNRAVAKPTALVMPTAEQMRNRVIYHSVIRQVAREIWER